MAAPGWKDTKLNNKPLYRIRPVEGLFFYYSNAQVKSLTAPNIFLNAL